MSLSGKKPESRLDELETRLAFQDDLIESLSETVARQDRELVALSRRLAALESKIDDLAEAAT
ncbi:MAG: SlyX family protein, partial [Xanthomonadales bacterium]|nr:SlyX family protein [Xanthomonadales bacterium]